MIWVLGVICIVEAFYIFMLRQEVDFLNEDATKSLAWFHQELNFANALLEKYAHTEENQKKLKKSNGTKSKNKAVHKVSH